MTSIVADPADVTRFRIDLRAWLQDQVTSRFRGLTFSMSAGDEWLSLMREWNALMADAGYATIAWPADYGGREAGVLEQVALAEELDAAEAPPLLNLLGISNIAPAILMFGTDAQKQTHLPPMARGDLIWSQGFSEPDAGSDLASLRTRAEVDGDHYVVTGQKVWTTLGHVADWCEVLVRTDPTVAKHAGISCLLIDLHSPGVDVRPLVTLTGQAEFAEIHFEQVRVPRHNLLGAENEGWMVAMTTLAHERAGVARLHLMVKKHIDRLLTEARSGNTVRGVDDRRIRQQLAALYTRSRILGWLAGRSIADSAAGKPPGPEGSLAKLVWASLEQDITLAAADLFGMDALSGTWSEWMLAARSYSIAGGTTEVNKDLVARMVLGLPKG